MVFYIQVFKKYYSQDLFMTRWIYPKCFWHPAVKFDFMWVFFILDLRITSLIKLQLNQFKWFFTIHQIDENDK